MVSFGKHRGFYNSPVRLGDAEIRHPELVLKTFCDDYQLFEIRQQLWDLIETAITTENSAFLEAAQREAILFFYNRLEEVMEALFLSYSTPNPKKQFSRRMIKSKK